MGNYSLRPLPQVGQQQKPGLPLYTAVQKGDKDNSDLHMAHSLKLETFFTDHLLLRQGMLNAFTSAVKWLNKGSNLLL